MFAIWYGKGPGVDRAGDALKHANMAGTARHGGALIVFGDDHAGKSSSLAHQSDLALAAHEIPVLYPSSVAEIIHYGLAGFAMSRAKGCGDCSTQSNCVAVQPLETELGRKRAIDQSACNKDFSCTKGFCPSFVTVENAKLKRTSIDRTITDRPIPEPELPALDASMGILITGIGGTGVVTVGAVLGMAAHLQGLGTSIFDMTGLSQKGGAVFSHVRLLRDTNTSRPAKLGVGEADVVKRLDGRAPMQLAANQLALRLLGDSIAVNMIMLGYVWQSGLIPLPREAIERAIELNGVAVPFNLAAFRIGRAAAAGTLPVDAPAGGEQPDLETFVSRRASDLTAYRNSSYAQTYVDLLAAVRKRESELGLQTEQLSWAVARSAFKLLAYKDEYEVARLYSDGRFRQELSQQFESGYRLSFHFAPPSLNVFSATQHRPRKLTFGGWVAPMLQVLARLKFLRETPLDIFGRNPERRLERQLRDAYLLAVRNICSELSAANYEAATGLAAAPQSVRGFGIVKESAARDLLAKLEQRGKQS